MLPQSLSLRMTALAAMSPPLKKEPTPMAMSHLKRMMKGCSFPAIWRRLYQTILSCRSKWPMPCEPKRWRPGGASPVTSRATSKETTGSMRKKWEQAPAAKGASPKQVSSREGQDETPSARLRHVPNKSSKVKRAPYLNPDAFCRFIGPKNLGKVLINNQLTSCLLDNGAQLNFITPVYAQDWVMDIISLDYLAQETRGSILLIRGLDASQWSPLDSSL